MAVDLTATLASQDRLERLLDSLHAVIPCDSTAVLELIGEELVPVAARGLAPDIHGRRFRRSEHPRLERVLQRGAPARFAADDPMPDPYDGLMLACSDGTRPVHACLICPLLDGATVTGLLTADALEPGVFDDIDDRFLEMVGALAGAALKTGHLIDALEDATRRHREVATVLQREAAQSSNPIVGTSAPIQRVHREVEMVAPSDFTVLVSGETGVGKELVAQGIHRASSRSEAPLVYVNCAALPETIVESELFGHVRGAFTGATAHRKGKLELADGGTLFLDEVGELPLHVQPKLLRFLQEGEIQRVGSDSLVNVDVRVVAATNRDLSSEVEEGHFRADLFHRLNMYPIYLPPLRERGSDIHLLAGHFLERYRRRLGVGEMRLTDEAREALAQATWPGNVRELDHVLGRAVLRASASADRRAPLMIDVCHLQLASPSRPPPASSPVPAPTDGLTLREAVEEMKRTYVRRAVDAHDGNWAAAARSLGMERSNLHHMARRLGLR